MNKDSIMEQYKKLQQERERFLKAMVDFETAMKKEWAELEAALEQYNRETGESRELSEDALRAFEVAYALFQ